MHSRFVTLREDKKAKDVRRGTRNPVKAERYGVPSSTDLGEALKGVWCGLMNYLFNEATRVLIVRLRTEQS